MRGGKQAMGDEATGQVLYESHRTRVTRARNGVVRKELFGEDAARRVRHERTVLQRLAGVAGIVQLAGEDPGGGTALLLRDDGGVPLCDAGRYASAELLQFAPELAAAVARMHARGVGHRDLNPANILASDAGPVLVDFDLATTFAEERPGFLHESQIAGTLAYLPPEQTGRTGRPVDSRADLYSLGATLYELATGVPPFGCGDPLRLIHDHLTRLPRPPAEVNPEVPAALSAIILRLLEKEPDRRYQSAHGLVFDLLRVRDGETAGFRLGERDFPQRLAPPSRLVGRDRELTRLAAAFAGVRHAEPEAGGGVLLVAGAPGVGKTRLISELRPAITEAGGWMVSGKFDQYRRDEQSDAIRQVIRGLGKLLLAEPEAELAAVRDRLRARLGPDIGLAAVEPEFQDLLEVEPSVPAGDPRTVALQLINAALDLFRALATPARPLVAVVDDVQWAGSAALNFLDALISSGGVPGLLLLVAYRANEIDQAHPFAAVLERWHRLELVPPVLRLDNLPDEDTAALLAEMLRMPAAEVAGLAAEISARTGGNPFDSVQLLNELRREGTLALGADGWSWDAATLRRSIGSGDVIEVLTARIEALPEPTRALLAGLGFLGGAVEPHLLERATGLDAGRLDELLLPALEEGLLVADLDAGTIRFVHDRVQQAATGRLAAADAAWLRLGLARRLAGAGNLEQVAAAQYLPSLDAVTDPQEQTQVAALCRRAAADAAATASWDVVERLLSAAERLAGRDKALATQRHTALYCLGRLAEADAIFEWLVAQPGEPLARAEATAVQISSLTGRGDLPGAVALGLRTLAELGLRKPGPEAMAERVGVGLDRAYRWVAESALADELARPELDDPRLLAIGEVCNRILPAVFFSDPATMPWLVGECVLIWADHGAAAALLGPLAHLGFVAGALRDDLRLGHRALQLLLEVGEARAYEPGTSVVRSLYALTAAHWFEPAEEAIAYGRRAQEGLIRGGDLRSACNVYFATVPLVLDSAPRLDDLRAEIEAGTALCVRTRNEYAAGDFVVFSDLVEALTEGPGPGGPDDFGRIPEGNPLAEANVRWLRSLAALIFGDFDAVARNVAGLPMLPFIKAGPHIMRQLFVRAVALTLRPGDAAGPAECRAWIAARADAAPENFGHLLQLLDAEQFRAAGEPGPAMRCYDAALRIASARSRPWQHAFIAERAGRFHLERGMEHTAGLLLAEARQRYAAWGATAKVSRLDSEFPALRPRALGAAPLLQGQQSVNLSADAIDLLGVLAASQALSSETTLDRLLERVTEVLGALTGATAVHVLIWNEDAGAWTLPESAGQTVEEAGAAGLIPLTAVRYAERRGQPLVAEDACQDARFARDPYVAGLERCSLLVVPVLNRGVRQALLVLANSLSQGAFSAERLDGVSLIAGQLAVSFANAQLYASLERKVAERTAALAEANRRLETLSITDPLTGLANRRRMAAVLDAEWRRGLRPKTPLAVAIVDVDHFKQYNDHYGHPAGDECLRKVATVLAQKVRTTDFVARYGGEEFVIVMPDTDGPRAYLVAERVRAAIEELAEPHEPTARGFVTASFGVVAAIPSADAEIQDLIDAADECLYAAKQGGRNRVVS
jgi:diguanylate cyclase (GGDEF)-like protein